MTEGPPHQHKVPSDLVQIPIIWRYELLRYLRSRRLVASVAIAFLVIGLIYIIPPALGSPYTGSETDERVDVVSLGSIGVPVGVLPYQYVGFLNHTGLDAESIVLSVNGTVVDEGPSTWGVSGMGGFPEINVPGQTVLILFVMDVSGANVTASYDWATPASEFEGGFLGFVSILIIISATFFGADSIVGEYQNRTGYLMFPNPVRRETLFFGKFAASMTAALIVIGIFYASIVLLSVFTVGAVDGHIGASFAYALLYILTVMAIAYLISSILKGSTGAIVLTFFLMIMILPIVDGVSMVAGVKVEGSVTFAAGVIQYIMQDPYPTDTSINQAGFTIHAYYPDPTIAAITMAAYALVAMVLSLILFKRKELAG